MLVEDLDFALYPDIKMTYLTLLLLIWRTRLRVCFFDVESQRRWYNNM